MIPRSYDWSLDIYVLKPNEKIKKVVLSNNVPFKTILSNYSKVIF